ncbi:MAG: site-specific tyrosine recombinase XerD [Planctomycetota bacterium]|nr:site-specific tyrosine recombinase XerD [Planctomycetota bacterium]
MIRRTSTPTADSQPLLEARSHLVDFLDYLQAECGLSLNTRKAYQRDLRDFLVHLSQAGVKNLVRLSPRHIEQFLRFCKQRELAVSSIARKLAAVKTFCRYLVLQQVLADDVSTLVETPKKWHCLPTVLDEQAVRQLLEAPAPGQDTHVLRDRAILSLLYATGMRASELVGLKLGDVNFNLAVVRLLGKGAKERIVPVADDALAAVRRYIDARRGDSLAQDKPEKTLMLSRTGRPLSREDVFRIVRKYVRRAALRGNVTPHTLRHCFATQLLAHGADLRSVQEMLGHADISTTQVYTHVDAARLKAIHKKFHPRG